MPRLLPRRGLIRSLSVVLGAVMIFGLAWRLRWPELDDSLWLDELHTAWCVQGNWEEVPARSGIGNQPATYFRALWVWCRGWGISERTLRLPSLLAGMTTIGWLGWLAYRWSGRPLLGFLTAAILAIDRDQVFFSQEARSYAILQLAGWLHAAVLLSLIREPTWTRRFVFVAGGALLVALHYTAILFLAAEMAFLWGECLYFSSRRNATNCTAYAWKHLLMDSLLISVACSPFLLPGWELGSRRYDWADFIARPSWLDLLRVSDLWLVVAVPATVGMVAWLWNGRARPIPRPSAARSLPAERLCWQLYLGPLLTAWLAAWCGLAPLFLGRYLICSQGAGSLVAALLLARVPSAGWRVLGAAAVVAGLLVPPNAPSLATRWRHGEGDRRQDWRGAVKFINETARSDAAGCLVRGGFLEAKRLTAHPDPHLAAYCLAPVQSLYALRLPAIPLPNAIPRPGDWSAWRRQLTRREANESSRPAGEWWLLINGTAASRTAILASLRTSSESADMPALALDTWEDFGEILVIRASALPFE